MSNFFNDPNANFAFDMISMEELSKQKPKKKEKRDLSTFEKNCYAIAGAIAGLLLALRS